MFFSPFRRICQDYCREFGIPLPSKHRYKELNTRYNASLFTDSYPDNDVTVAQFLDTIIWGNEIESNMKIQGMNATEIYIDATPFQLAPLPKAVPTPKARYIEDIMLKCSNQEGKKPMRYNDNCAVASVSVSSDSAVQREYFLSRLETANNYRKDRKLAEFFNLNVNNQPKTYKELIDAIKNDKFKLNDKRVKQLDAYTGDEDYDDDFGGISCGPFDGIIWDGPQPDHAGYDKAMAEKTRLYTLAKDTIMSGDAAAMAKAVQDFDAWMPTPDTVTVH